MKAFCQYIAKEQRQGLLEGALQFNASFLQREFSFRSPYSGETVCLAGAKSVGKGACGRRLW